MNANAPTVDKRGYGHSPLRQRGTGHEESNRDHDLHVNCNEDGEEDTVWCLTITTAFGQLRGDLATLSTT